MLLVEGRAQEALDVYERLASSAASAEPDLLPDVARAKWSLGRVKDADAALERIKSRSPRVFPLEVAFTCAWMQRRDCAFEWLDRALRERDAELSEGFRTHPFLRSLHGDPRWKALLRKMDLPVD